MKLATACLVLVLGAFFSSVSAQQTEGPAYQPFSPAPYRVGERLTYNVSFSSFISAAHVELLVAARGTFFGREGIKLTAHVETNGVVNAALVAINNDYVTYIDAATGQPFRAEKTIREGARSAQTFVEFSQPAATDIPATQNLGLPGSFDFFSAVYRLRALPLASGSSYAITVRDENQNYRMEVRVRGREMLKTSVGSFNAIVSQVRIKNETQGESYSLRVYFSDDQRHIPLLITTRVSTGEIQVELAGSVFVTPPVATPTPTPTPSPGTPPARQPVPIPATPAGEDAGVGDLPFKVGEVLNYRVYLPSIPQPIATAAFQVRARQKYFERDGLLFTVNAQTTNALQKLFVANDLMSSYVDPKTLLPFRTEFMFNEGRHRSASKLTINQEYGTATGEQGEKIDIPIGTHDYLSYFYLARTFKLSPGKRNALSILVNNKPKTLVVTAVKRESVQIGSQTIPAMLISLTTDDAQPDKYQIRGWISDDKRRLPLRLTAVTELGPIRADLDIIPLTPQ